MKLRICEQWDMDVPDILFEKRPGQPFTNYSLKFISQHIACRYTLLRSMPGLLGSTVLELFGGLGLSATLWRAAGASWHRVHEIDPVLVKHLRRQGFDTFETDVFDIQRIGHCDVIDADFGRFTYLQWVREQRKRHLVDLIFKSRSRYVLITDEAVTRLVANREPYSKIFGRPITSLANYLNAWSEKWVAEYGYYMRRAEYNHGSINTLWVEGRNTPFIQKTSLPFPGVKVIE